MSKRKNKKLRRAYSSLNNHSREGKILKSPFNKIPGMQLRSWYDECIPNIMWACILAAHLKRTEYLDLFRFVIIDCRELLSKAEYEKTFITHNYLSTLSDKQFDIFFKRVLTHQAARKLLSSLLEIDCLPDIHHWRRHLEKPENKQEAFIVLAEAVNKCFDHQTEESTDIRWMKVMHLIVCDRLIFSEKFSGLIEEFRLYPEKGDMRSIRPSIRSMELAVRSWEFGEEKGISPLEAENLPQKHGECFWQEMLNKTPCMPLNESNPPQEAELDIRDQLMRAYECIANHFHTTLKNTSVDPRHDAAFGIVLYALSLCLGISLGYNHTFADGRIVLRSVMEAFVTLHYLKHRDELSLWKKFRTDGVGKTKLAFLKNISAEDLPDFFDAERIERLANEDMWLELQDINIGSWSDSNLRTIAIESGEKEVYDKYYDWTSGYAHGHWICVRDTTFTICANPLHRFHRIPAIPRFNMPSILSDAFKLINRMFDDLNNLYPSFKMRLKDINASSERK